MYTNHFKTWNVLYFFAWSPLTRVRGRVTGGGGRKWYGKLRTACVAPSWPAF